jgi:hypothetical protein
MFPKMTIPAIIPGRKLVDIVNKSVPRDKIPNENPMNCNTHTQRPIIPQVFIRYFLFRQYAVPTIILNGISGNKMSNPTIPFVPILSELFISMTSIKNNSESTPKPIEVTIKMIPTKRVLFINYPPPV